jgi:hypothetical protein
MVVAAALPYPPVAPGFLALFDGRTASVVWENPSLGLFGIVVPPQTHNGRPPQQHFSLPETPPPAPTINQSVVEVNTRMIIPTIPPEEQCTDPPVCLHGKPTLKRTVMRRDSPNIGRPFFVCCSSAGEGSGSCGFFRWGDELNQYSVLRARTPLSADDVKRETLEVDPGLQLEAWSGVQQGTEKWHRLRACRVTASNFGSVHRTNHYCSPADLLRNILWPSNMDSVAMKYGSLNEKAALWRFLEWLTDHADRPDLPIYMDEPGIWLSAQHPFLAGSPDGVLYETVDACTIENGGGMYYRCRRSLVEIKTPWKLRNRAASGDFYPSCHQKNGRLNCIPCSYYDQIMGNAYLMGLGYVYFIVLAPNGFQVTVEPYDPVYVTQSLLPSLVDFWHQQVLPALEERDLVGKDNVPVGWIPSFARKRGGNHTDASG